MAPAPLRGRGAPARPRRYARASSSGSSPSTGGSGQWQEGFTPSPSRRRSTPGTSCCCSPTARSTTAPRGASSRTRAGAIGTEAALAGEYLRHVHGGHAASAPPAAATPTSSSTSRATSSEGSTPATGRPSPPSSTSTVPAPFPSWSRSVSSVTTFRHAPDHYVEMQHYLKPCPDALGLRNHL